MTTSAQPYTAAAHAPRLKFSVEALCGALLWLTGLFGAFVFMEPSPYEVAALLAMVAFVTAGLTLTLALMPFVVLLVLYNLGFAIAIIPVLDQSKALLWVLVSCYLGATSLFFALVLGNNTQARLAVLLNGYMAAAMIAAIAGIVGYFRLVPGVDLFLLYDRARGTFNDPNVLGAFLVLPALIAFQRLLTGRLAQALRNAMVLAVLLMGIFLSFSRGAWGQLAIAAVLMMGLSFLTTRSTRERARIVLFAVLGLFLVAVFIAALLSIDQVAGLFKERANLDQAYDVGHTGRFGRHVLGFVMALDYPFGIGPLQFRNFFPEDPHNAYLNAFMSGGWLAGFSYFALVAATLVMGLRFAFVTTPWRPLYLAVYSAFVGLAAESFVIDSDHWRHYFLILGVLWGLMAASRPYLRARPGVRPAFLARAPSHAAALAPRAGAA